ncbi:MAG TPA: rRNA maturation RNase YbeY [Gemmatimonadales bacterium]|nr:rRNA maturation RNase YbeY [Gemmatimonadales bacterium]
MSVQGRSPVPATLVRRVVRAVLRGERRRARMSVTFLGRERMRRLNARYRGHDRPTDVLAFTLPQPDGLPLGDVYICGWVAAREARARGLPIRQEVIRLLVHGTLHALGYDHPEGVARERSAMWRRQERYVEALA